MVMWILPVFRRNTAITQITQKTLRDPILPMFSQCSPYVSVMLGCGILRFSESQCFSGELGRTVGLR